MDRDRLRGMVRDAVARSAESGRNNEGLRLACNLRDGGCGRGEAEDAMMEFQRSVANAKPDPYSADEALASLRSAFARPPRAPLPLLGQERTARRPDPANEALKRAFPTAPPPARQVVVQEDSVAKFQRQWGGIQPLRNSPAVSYLASRGIPQSLAAESGVLYHPQWFFPSTTKKQPGARRPAVVFPLCDLQGNVIAAHGRRIDPPGVFDHLRSKVTYGPRGEAMFWTAGSRVSEGPVILVEGPMDALSIALAGCPAVGRVATDYPTWFGKWVGLRYLHIGWDADSVGEAKIKAVAEASTRHGATCLRLRPRGGKDANEMLMNHGLEYLQDWLKTAGVTKVHSEHDGPTQSSDEKHRPATGKFVLCDDCSRVLELIPYEGEWYRVECTCGGRWYILERDYMRWCLKTGGLHGKLPLPNADPAGAKAAA